MQSVKNKNKNITPIYIIRSKDKQKNYLQILPKQHIFLKIDYLIVTSHGNFIKVPEIWYNKILFEFYIKITRWKNN